MKFDENPEMSLFEQLRELLPWSPGEDQTHLIRALDNFVSQGAGKHVLLIQGYAGTGKTSVLSAFVKWLSHERIRVKLLAPTGRAAKVFSRKSGHDAFTIHKQIYRRRSKADVNSPISLQPNLYKHTVFIVDEASMIGDYTMGSDGSVNTRNLLEDLLEYVFSGENCRLILMGDMGQLPPVGSQDSPALNAGYLQYHFPTLSLASVTLKEVMRQSSESGILHNATRIRSLQTTGFPKLEVERFPDVMDLRGGELQENLESSFDQVGQEETIVITRSNKRANVFNQQVRSRILWFEEELCVGDTLMVVKNNYFWVGDDSRMGFIANGEMIRVRRILAYENFYGFRFARVLVQFVDYESTEDMEVIIHLNSLQSEGPALTRDQMKTLFFEVEKDYFHVMQKKKRYEAILGNRYFNALQVKYAYAVTCHKSQGGQWAHVYIDPGYLSEDHMGTEYNRWLYTAVTRATEKLFLVNFDRRFFGG